MAQHAHDCHWSVPTLLTPHPYWLSAWDAPWTCWKDSHITVLPTTDDCRNCPAWRERRTTAGDVRAIPPPGAEPAGMDL